MVSLTYVGSFNMVSMTYVGSFNRVLKMYASSSSRKLAPYSDWRLDIQNILFQQNRPAFLPHIQIFDFGNQQDIQIAIPWTHISAY